MSEEVSYTPVHCEIVHDAQGLAALGEKWDELAREAQVGLFLSHRWLTAWWRAFHGVDELWVLTLREGEKLVAAWPLHLRAPRSGPLKVNELRVLGDLGGAQRSIICAPGDLARASEAFVDALAAERGWDVLETPVVSQRVADALERAAGARGVTVDRAELLLRAYAELPSPDGWAEFVRARGPARRLANARYRPRAELPRALDELLRLMRKEWAAREAASPAADPHALEFLAEMAPQLEARGEGRVGLLTVDGEVRGADLVVVDEDKHVQLLRGIDPELGDAAALELLLGTLEVAVLEGARRFEFAPSDADAPLQTARQKTLRMRMWNTTTAGRLHRGVEAVREATGLRKGEAPRPPLALRALDNLRGRLREAAPETVTRAVARLAAYTTLHLYRGELFVRDVRDTGEVQIRLLPRDAFEALSDAERDSFAARLDLAVGYCRQKWDRGDLVVLAEVAGRPAGPAAAAGIVWCARGPVYVPDIGREVRPGVGECYIHDVYVHPDERGRQVAPAMLDFLARELRRRDVYRAWALIERSNTASTRAFEKAAYASVADVVYVRMGLASRLVVRPPDPEARAFLGVAS
jgi:ribosomal protein S18 acetylase RimI-like enzyme/CelD/BcsL family acetyltransferase involved in cellulose biosynthesis